MQLKMTKQDSIISLYCDETKIESYSLTEAIDFKKLMEFLIGNELSEKIELQVDFENPDEQENTLISLIRSIFEKYNDGVDELKSFIENN